MYAYTADDVLGRVRSSAQTTDGLTYSMPDYLYDLAGNLTSEQYLSGRIIKTEYDAAGRAAGVQTYTYDVVNRLQSAEETAGGTSNWRQVYYYDGDGRMVRKAAGGVTTVFVYDASGRLVAEYGGAQPATDGSDYETQESLGAQE
jgi:YD repeat-containing protein